MLKQKYFLTDFFILSAEKQPIKSSWRKIEWLLLSLSSCSNDDEVFVTSEQIIGTWDVIWAEQDGESIDIPKGYIYMKLNQDGSYRTTMFDDYYIGTYRLEGNTVVGTTKDPITEYYKFTSLEGNNASIDYSNSIGTKYKFKAVKR
ncbi:hypothetical protein [Phocaeicola coprocola]|uniref:hypothetical protein n=1 Tax=Phocaeicola coprocola TaxID=310298 RepID=UPI0032BF9821